MPKLTVQKDVDLHYVDYGKGTPVVLIHGWPLSHKSWEPQIPVLVNAGYRVIAYDRRGFGESSQPWNGYDYDTFADDLHALITQLKLEKAVLVGFSMGGGEVVRYLSKHGDKKIAKAVLVSSIIPLVKQKKDNPDGVPQKVLDEIADALETDRLGFLPVFLKIFYNYSEKDKSVSKELIQFNQGIASNASPQATLMAAKAWMDTDFREEAKKIEVPTLIIHGDSDNNVPIKTSGEQAAKLIPGSTFKVYKGGPHGLNVTHRDQLNKDLLDFLG